MSTLGATGGRSQSVDSFGGQHICEICSEKSKILKAGRKVKLEGGGSNLASCLLFLLASFKH